MAQVEARLSEMGLELPAELETADEWRLPFSWIRVHGNRVYVSGHTAVNSDGSVTTLRGKVGAELSVERGYEAARLTALSALADLKRAIGDLDRVTAWLRVFGMVNVAPGFNQTPEVINGFSDLILELYCPERGDHARSAIGVAALPGDIPVEIEAELEITE